jgi:hypothetical protein
MAVRTLGTQVRLRRLLRVEGELVQQFAPVAADSRTRRSASRRLVQAVGDVRDAWTADVRLATGPGAADQRLATGPGAGLGDLRRHVSRTLAGLDLLAAGLERTTVDVLAFDREFREAAVPLLFFLRGVEDAGEQALLAWLSPGPLRRTA